MEENNKQMISVDDMLLRDNVEIFSPTNNFIVNLKKETTNQIPEYQTTGSAGFDIASNEFNIIKVGETKIIHTGLYIEVPFGYELQVRSRSGLASKNNIFVLNSPGCVDSDYRGEVMVILHNCGNSNFHIQKGDRIAQGVFTKIYRANFKLVDKLSETERGSAGLGSTGV